MKRKMTAQDHKYALINWCVITGMMLVLLGISIWGLVVTLKDMG